MPDMRYRHFAPKTFDIWLQTPSGLRLFRSTHYSAKDTGPVLARYKQLQERLRRAKNGSRSTIMVREVDQVTGRPRDYAMDDVVATATSRTGMDKRARRRSDMLARLSR